MKDCISLDLDIEHLFDNNCPDQVWEIATAIIRCISPAYDFSRTRSAYHDVVSLFRGNYPGYCAIRTLYHDLDHTLDVFLCTVRIMHGVHVSGEAAVDDDTISLLCIAAMMHDVGYAQRQGEEAGTGAQYTQSHIERGIAFARHYLAERDFPSHWGEPLACIIRSTNPNRQFRQIDFPDQRTRLAGKILGSADLVGQMADRAYLEKLLLLYLEFKEAHFGNYQSMYELLHKTLDFYSHILTILEEDFDNIYTRLSWHFEEFLGVARNYYQDSIEKNISYLTQVISRDEENYLAMLKRQGVVQKVRSLPDATGA